MGCVGYACFSIYSSYVDNVQFMIDVKEASETKQEDNGPQIQTTVDL